jgi:hypothetical protein
MMQVMKDIGGIELPETLADLTGKTKQADSPPAAPTAARG